MGGVAGLAGFGGVDDVYQLAGGDVVEMEIGVGGGEIVEGSVEPAHGGAEEHVDVGGNATVGVELGEYPLGPALDVDVEVEPEAQAEEGGGIEGGEVGVLDAGEDGPFAATPVEAEGALDEEEAARVRKADAGGAAAVVGLGAIGGGGVVDGIDGGGLGGVGGGGHGEIGVTAGLLKDAQFIGDATMGAGGV